MRAKKHLGQHFLTSKAVLADIITASQLRMGETVLEIGPGTGVLTQALIEAGVQVVAIEADPDMVAILEEKFAPQIERGALSIVFNDILQVALTDFSMQELVGGTKTYKLVANIPYYITGEIIRRFLTADVQPASMTLLVQKEVAERIARSRKESILSISVKAYGTPRYVSTVPARYFSPVPKVDSAVLTISDISKRFFTDFSEERFFKIVRAGFSSKRKKLLNNLSSFGSKDVLIRHLASVGLRENARAEEVSLEQWGTLAKALATEH